MTTHDTLKRQLGLHTATALVVGEVIGVGIFLTPAGMAKSLGSPALVLVVWLLIGLAVYLCSVVWNAHLQARGMPRKNARFLTGTSAAAFSVAIALASVWMHLWQS